MMYLQRSLTSAIMQASQAFGVILLTGPRQVGKTTLLEHCARDNTAQERHYVTLDDMDARQLACTDPELFFKKYPPPIIIDEVQYAPEIFVSIKILCDRLKKPGLFWLTGSQKFHLMRNVTESLAGRVAIFDLLGLSQAETSGAFGREAIPFLPTREWIEERQDRKTLSPMSLMALYERIWRGSFPQLMLNPLTDRDLFYHSYVQTYIQRDVREMTGIQDPGTFYQFLRAVAARTGQLLNYSDLARDVGLDQKTMRRWLGILEASGLLYLLHPYHNNVLKRLLKTPKLYFLDTGLCAFLTRWHSPEALEAGAMSGAILETYVFTEILKSYWHSGKSVYLYYYRDKDQKEIDFLIEQDKTLYPIECKKSAQPSSLSIKHFCALDTLAKRGHGAVVCLKESAIPLSQSVDAIPVSYL